MCLDLIITSLYFAGHMQYGTPDCSRLAVCVNIFMHIAYMLADLDLNFFSWSSWFIENTYVVYWKKKLFGEEIFCFWLKVTFSHILSRFLVLGGSPVTSWKMLDMRAQQKQIQIKSHQEFV